MNYKESERIIEEIKGAKTVLVNCHRSPDPDSVGSALAMRRVLLDMDKFVEVICPDSLASDTLFLKGAEDVQKIDYDDFDFSKYDLFLILDSSDWVQVLGYGKEKIPDIKKIVIDHHHTNDEFGDINLVDSERSSTAEVVYRLLEDWGIKPSKEIAHNLLAGIIFDTSLLQTSSADAHTAKAVFALMEKGADKNEIVSSLYKNISFNKARLIGELLVNLNIDEESGFAWSAIPFEKLSEFPDSVGIKSMAANTYASSIEGTNFGIIMVEEKKGQLNISFRAKEGYDISKIAQELGGGGHKQAGAAVIRNVPFDQAVIKVLEAARKYAKKS